MTQHFGDRLHEAVKRSGTCACIGLDPRPRQFPPGLLPDPAATNQEVADCIRRWALTILDVLAGQVPVVKPQSACYEAWGPEGVQAFADVCRAASERGILVLGDTKRGDIGSTADHYAQAYLATDSAFSCDAITVNPYLGADSLEPFFSTAEGSGRGVFVLCKTSNPSSRDFQDWKGEDGRPLYEKVAGLVADRSEAGPSGYSSLALVVGATYPAEAARIRELAPTQWFLIPGYGHQGGTKEGLEAARGADGSGIIVSSSRGITDAWQKKAAGTEFARSIESAVGQMKSDLNTLATLAN